MRELVKVALAERVPLAVPAGVLAQVWRASARQARLARLLGSPLVEVVPLDRSFALAVGKLCAETGARDVVDVSVVVCARQRGRSVVTRTRKTCAGSIRSCGCSIRWPAADPCRAADQAGVPAEMRARLVRTWARWRR
jgi:hypothetical protein